MTAEMATTQEAVQARILAGTGRRIRDLSVEIHEGLVILRGRTGSFYVKQLAQEAVREVAPDAPIKNGIVVG